ncbi:radical SAM protein [Thermococcus sp. GR7]|uniref:radical SAM protein n=1 Tax=unclassified Thermococcus TaxID=2627626 RepID=UPI0014305EC3|nr:MULTISPECIES: radical SAM protein [unclassified Thermococcus]NJE46932.1 radical SAM protein [Thermococcus sp. GR7]NJE78429.1 radical SAM protein [Thermococcus sp. GR4]NJF23274.1 radical SAM protein [Thermococcus sp. GR5]
MKVEVLKRKAKSIYTRSKIPGVNWTVNQYVGCAFACRYCYAKFLCRWRDYGEWGSWVEVKTNAPEFARKRVQGSVVMSTVSDPYQPIEAELKLTRRVLRYMDKRNELSILTRSPLVTRDIDLFREFRSIEVGLTINGVDGREKRLFEPLAPLHKARVNALQTLYDESVRTYVFVSPIIPGVTDVRTIVEETRGLADYYFFEVLNLRAAGREFERLLMEEYSESYEVLTDNEKFESFIGALKKEIKALKVRAEGVETHREGWEFVPL